MREDKKHLIAGRTGSYSKVLIVGASPFGADDATAITMRSLFADWPDGKITQVCANVPSGNESCRQIKYISTRRTSRHPKKFKLALGPVIGVGEENDSFKKQLSLRLRTTLRAVRDYLFKLRTARIKNEISGYGPDIIYALGGSLSWTRLAVELAGILDCPIVFHFMDDWPATLYRDAYGKTIWQYLLNRMVRKALKLGVRHFAISQDMALEYRSRYGKEFLPYMRCLERVPVIPKHPGDDKESLKLVYCGGLHLGRWRVLSKIGQVIQARSELDASLTIYAPASHLKEVGGFFGGLKSITIGGSLDPGKEQSTLSLYDVAVHIESFEARAAAYTRLSISAKIPMYFAIPLPILAIGPGNLSSMRWISSSRAGVVVEKQERYQIEEALVILKSRERRKELAEAAFRMYKEFHEASSVRNRFLESLNRIIDQTRVHGN